MTTKLSKTLYQTLLDEIAAIYDGAMKEMSVAVDGILKKAYWQIGERIVKVEQKGTLHAGYGSHLLEKLSSDLSQMNRKGFSVTNLRNMRLVYSAFPIHQISDELTWSHYVVLSSIHDQKQRRVYEQKAVAHHWGVDELKKVLKEKNVILDVIDSKNDDQGEDNPDPKVIRLAFKRGILHTYRVVEPFDSSSGKDSLWLDCGFSIYHELKMPSGLKVKPGEGVSAVRSKEGAALKRYDSKDFPLKAVLYTYPAKVFKVIDGDTLTVIADLGFGLFSKQKLRLRRINAPEMTTARGIEAKEFVLNQLQSSERIVVKTYSTDLYDRYLVDVFYPAAGGAGLPGGDDPEKIAREGILLNQELLDEGLADLWQTVDPNELAFLNY